MKRTVKALYKEPKSEETVIIEGWVRNNRAQKAHGFIDLHDGTQFDSVQVVYEERLDNFKDIQKIQVGAALRIEGLVILTPKAKQPLEVKATAITVVGTSSEDYPIQPKRHSREFLREHAHLRPRTNLFNALYRVRNMLTYAIHTFFQTRDFIHVTSPIITANDAEGAGALFQVTTLDLNNIPKDKEGNVDYTNDFFGRQANLTVTGQLQAEVFAQAFKKAYTFGPTFRAEKSHTSIHASEFLMIEPEIAFSDNNDNMDLAEEMVKYLVDYILKNAQQEMAFFDKYVQKGLIEKLTDILNKPFARITHQEAIEILKNADKSFEFKPEHGKDIATEHEKYLTDYFKVPVFIKDWPKAIKAFYMRLNDDQETVAAMDLIVPGGGELIGGSQREERMNHLLQRMDAMNIPKDDLWWYLDLRKYGSTPHAGFGLGFDRMLVYVTGVENIRDTIPFPRTPRQCEF